MKRIFLPTETFGLLLLVILTGSAFFPKQLEAAAKYSGAEGCNCHKMEISDWERSSHARAFDLLKAGKKKSKKKKAGLDPKKDYTTDEKCLPCHVTGFGEEGGFKDMVTTPAMVGVGCESCHGPGSEYRVLHKDKSLQFTREEAKALGAVYGSVDPAVCNKCHDHKKNPFNADVDDKYLFDHKKALNENRSFHDYYEQEAKH